MIITTLKFSDNELVNRAVITGGVCITSLLLFWGEVSILYRTSVGLGLICILMASVVFLKEDTHTEFWYYAFISQLGQWGILAGNIDGKIKLVCWFLVAFGISTIKSPKTTLFFLEGVTMMHTCVTGVNRSLVHRDILFIALNAISTCVIYHYVFNKKKFKEYFDEENVMSDHILFECIQYGSFLSTFLWEFSNLLSKMGFLEHFIGGIKTPLFLLPFGIYYYSGMLLGMLFSYYKNETDFFNNIIKNFGLDELLKEKEEVEVTKMDESNDLMNVK